MYPYINIGPLHIGTYGIAAAVGFLVSWAVFKRDMIRRGLNRHLAGMMVISVTVAGFLGAKVYFLCETPSVFHHGLKEALFSRSGLSWLGGLIAGTGTLAIWSRVQGIRLITLFDMAAPIGALSYGFGRVGCLLSGDGDYGTPTSLPWGMAFPHGTVPVYWPVHPAPIYESLFSFTLFWVLWRMWNAERPAAVLAGTFLVASGLARFLVEFIKLNPRIYWGLTNAQVVSIVSVAAGIGLLYWSLTRGESETQVGSNVPRT